MTLNQQRTRRGGYWLDCFGECRWHEPSLGAGGSMAV